MTKKLAPLILVLLALLVACASSTTSNLPGLNCAGFPQEALGVCTITQGLSKSQTPELKGEFYVVRDWEAGTWYYVDEVANAVLVYVNNDKKTPAWFSKAEVGCHACPAPTPTPRPTSTPLPPGSDPDTEYQSSDLRDEILQVHNGWEQWCPVGYLQKLHRETGAEFRICVNRRGCGFYIEGKQPGEWVRQWELGQRIRYLQYVRVDAAQEKEGCVRLIENPLYGWLDNLGGGIFICLADGWEEP